MKTRGKAIIGISTLAVLIVSVLCLQSVIPAKAKSIDTHTSQAFDKLPLGLAPAVANALQGNLPESYHIKKSGKTYHAKNESQGMSYAFSSNGPIAQGTDGSWNWAMTLKEYGYVGESKPVLAADLTNRKGRVEYKRGQALTEWYKNTAFGLEQGFTLNSRPNGSNEKNSDLALEIAISGTLMPKLQGKTLLLQNKKGEFLCRYTGLYAYDANHHELPARLTLADSTLRIIVDDSNAVYPITIDPWVQKAKLTASDAVLYQEFGKSVSTYTISYKDYVVIGAGKAWGIQYNTGAAYVFEEPDNGWSSTSTFTTKLMASDGEAGDQFGQSVDIYHDYIVVGAYLHDTAAGETDAGAVYVFERPGTSWSDAGETMTENVKLTANPGDRNEGDNFGYSVAAASDIIAVGARWDDHESPSNENFGAAYIFQKGKFDTWDEASLSTKLIKSNPDDFYQEEFGTSVDVKSISGNVVVVGAYGEANSAGAAYVFVEPVADWSGETTTETARLSSTDIQNADQFGKSVAIDGNTILVGAPGYYGYCIDSWTDDIGAAFVFEKPVTGWVDMTDETARLTAGDCANLQYFGCSVSIDGDTAVIGARGDNSYTGAAYIFKRPESGSWVDMTHTYKITARDGAASDDFGSSVAINGATVIVGAFDESNKGAAYIFETGSPAMPWMIPLLLN